MASNKTTTRKTTKIAPCNCSHNAQDEFHGKQNRVHNLGIKNEEWRCTVCGKAHSAKGA